MQKTTIITTGEGYRNKIIDRRCSVADKSDRTTNLDLIDWFILLHSLYRYWYGD
ncbi:hypothetical protein [Nostoc sp. 'Lobaria pulmonaria (5183) cyanobiont']|uniref:hypothetical protein n=1 Tax=Nostoc sp. 'Lobaria pulmonaria (5183) cyanobiont' TaxID=1618022 RepID=UPI00131A2332|nr:hypothetical protein [Nostoc sp. 'Lobaria pulmonaria (5183) cyanobiont']